MLGHRADIGGLRWRRFLVRGMFAGRGLRRVGGMLTRRGLRAQHFLNRFAKLAFGVEEELGGGDDAFARLEATEDLVIALGTTRTESDFTWLEFSAFQSDEDGVLFAAAQNGHIGHKHGLGHEKGMDFHGGEHAGLEKEARIGKFHAHARGARFLFHGRIDVSDLSAKAAVRHVGELDDGLLADLEERQVLLVNFGQHPDFADVANAIEGLPGFHHLPCRAFFSTTTPSRGETICRVCGT